MNVDVDVEVDIQDKAGDRGVERDQLDGTMQDGAFYVIRIIPTMTNTYS